MIGRRHRLRVVTLAALAVAVTTLPAGAQSTSANLDQARQDAARAKSSFERLARAYADQNTKLNLTELAAHMELSKSAINHRLRRLVEMADALTDPDSGSQRPVTRSA